MGLGDIEIGSPRKGSGKEDKLAAVAKWLTACSCTGWKEGEGILLPGNG